MAKQIIKQLKEAPAQFIVALLVIFVGALTIFDLVIGLSSYIYPIFPIASFIFFPDSIVKLGTLYFIFFNLMLVLMGFALFFISECTTTTERLAAPDVFNQTAKILMSFSATVAQMALFVGASFVILLLAPS